MNNIVFLDIDGVLNYTEWYICPRNELKSDLDPFCIERIKVLCRITNSKIVISSDWRYSTGYKKLLKDNDFIELIIDKTPEHMFDVSQEDKSRGSEIQHWWNSFGKLYKDYIIIDDRTDFFDYQKSKLIRVNPQVGFTDLNLLDVVYLLN